MMTAVPLGIVLGLVLGQASGEPIVLEKGVAQLFVDDFLVEQQQDLDRTLHQPVKENGGAEPVINLPKDAFGGYSFTLQANGSLVYDAKYKIHVLYAIGYSSEMGQVKEKAWEKVRLYRFTSTDRMTWSEGERVFPRSPDDVLDPNSGARATNMDLFSCYYDDTDSEYPYKGLMWYANWGTEREGTYFLRSRDGKRFERGAKVFEGNAGENDPSSRRITQDGRELVGAGDVTLFTYDPPTRKYLALIKFYSPNAVEFDNRLRSRAYAWLDRLDTPFDMQRIARVALVPPAAEKDGDMPHDEYYASTAWRCGSMWLGGLKIWHGGGDYPYSAAGCAFLKLVSSRDGLHWSKVRFAHDDGRPEAWVPNGPEGGNGGRNDGGYLTELSTGPFRLGDELIYYYGCSSWGKNHPTGVRITGGGIFRARLRLDGFVSVDGGTLTTKPLTCSTSRLDVNAVGPVTVEVLDSAGEARHRQELTGDSLRHSVPVPSTPFRLRFQVQQGGRLYSFASS